MMVLLRRLAFPVVALLLVVIGGAATARAEAPSVGGRAFVQSFIDEGVLLLKDRSASRQDQVTRFRTLLYKYFAVPSIARFTLGRYWNQATPAQQEEFTKLFEDLVVYGYVKRFSDYSGQKMVIQRAVDSGDSGAIVYTNIQRASGEPISVDWRVGVTKTGDHKLTDVVVENISLAQTWRSDFASVMQQGGGSIDHLLDHLRAKVTQLRGDLGV